MKQKDDNRKFRMIPLAKRDWAMMILSFIALVLLVMSVIVLYSLISAGSGDLWIWTLLILSVVSSLLTLFALITGDSSWFLVGLLIAWSR